MKRILLIFVASVAWIAAYAQYFGQAVFTEGFDREDVFDKWQQKNEIANDPTLWKVAENDIYSFTDIDATSVSSAVLILRSENTKLTLTSPEIDLSGKESLQIGFYGYDLYYCLRGGIDFRFRVTKDNGLTWEDLYKKGDDPRSSELVKGWNLYKYALSAQFDGAKVRLQFYVEVPEDVNPSGLEGYIDGVFISERPAIEPEILSVNYSTYDKEPTAGAFGKEEPVTIRIINNGSQPIASIDLYYRIDERPEVVETYVPQESIKPGEVIGYTFHQKADLSAAQTSFVLKTGVRMEGDNNSDNNELIAYMNNLTASIPYIPGFVKTENGAIIVSADEWVTMEKNSDAYWDYNTGSSDFYWMIEPEWAGMDCDAYVISRPVYLEEGKTYSVGFNVYTAGEGSGINKMKVYVATDKELEQSLTEIWENEAIGTDNAMNSAARFQAPSDGIYYFAFNCLSTPGAGEMRLNHIAVREVAGNDAGIINLISPVDHPYLFGDAESVEVLIQNLGLAVIPANTLKVNMRLNDGEVVSETIAKVLEPNEQLKHTFTAKLDFSDVYCPHLLAVWTSLSEDQNKDNDTIKIDYTSTVTSIPYTPDFGTNGQKTSEPDYWTVVNNNADYYTFVPVSDSDLGTYVYNYGGGLINWSTITIPTSDEQLYSRPMKLLAGAQYKISFLSKVGMSNASMPLAVNLYKVNGETRTLAGNIWAGVVTSTAYQEMVLNVEIDDTGVYEVEFSVVNEAPVDFKIYLGSFRFTKVYDTDISLQEIVMPTTQISCYNTFPIGAIVRNEGKKTVTSFSLIATAPSIGEVRKDYNGITLEPNDIYLVYFDKNLTFNGTEPETITMTIATEKDGDEANNRKEMDLKYINPENIPYTPQQFLALENWAVINNNKDAYRFVPVKTGTVGFQYIGSKDVEASDLLVTPCLALEKAATYSLDFRFGVNQGDTASMAVYVYDVTTAKRVDLVRLESIVKGSEYLGYFTVPDDGNYTLCFEPSGKVPSLFISASPSIKKVTEKPDIQLVEVTAPKGDAVYTSKENLTVTFRNKGKLPLSGIPFICEVGENVYHSFCPQYIPAGSDLYTMEFPEIDLYMPGEYTIQVTADVTAELTPDDNSFTYKINSLPVPDVAIVSLDAPESGILGNDEAVTITLKNKGKGALTNIPLQCVVTAGAEYSETLNGTVAGPLAEGAILQYTFDEKVDMYNEDTYQFVITSAFVGDVDDTNNRLDTSISSSHKSFDAGVTNLISPTNAILSQTENVTITVKNYSGVDLFDIPVTAEVNFLGSDATEIQIITGIIAGIKSGESVDYTFAQTVQMQLPGEYRVKAYTHVQNDVNPENDICTATVKCLKQDVGVTAVISPESGEELGIQNVTIEVKNFGEAPVTRIPVRYKIGAMPQLGIIDETVQPGESFIFTFPARYEFVGYKKYTVTANTELEDDANPANDVCTKEVENSRSTGIGSVNAGLLSIYPNPSAGVVTIKTGDIDMQTVRVFNLQGKLLGCYDSINAPVYRVNLNLPDGNYLVRVTTSVGKLNYKLIISMNQTSWQ